MKNDGGTKAIGVDFIGDVRVSNNVFNEPDIAISNLYYSFFFFNRLNITILPVAKSLNASGKSERACSISCCDLAPPRSSFDKPSLCKHSVSLIISTRRSNVRIVSRLKEKSYLMNRNLDPYTHL